MQYAKRKKQPISFLFNKSCLDSTVEINMFWFSLRSQMVSYSHCGVTDSEVFGAQRDEILVATLLLTQFK